MLTVIKQELKACRRRWFPVCIALFSFYILCILVNIIGYNTQNFVFKKVGIVLYVLSIFIGLFGVTIFSLFAGSGNMYRVLMSDENYLNLLVPRRSYEIVGGRMIVNLIEVTSYLIISCLLLSFIGPLASIIWKGTDVFSSFGIKIYDINDNYWTCVKGFYNAVFVVYLDKAIQLLVIYLISFSCGQVVLNFTFTLYVVLIRNKKKKILMFILLVVIFNTLSWFTSRKTGLEGVNTYIAMWIPTIRYLVCSIVLFIVTCVLMENKLEA